MSSARVPAWLPGAVASGGAVLLLASLSARWIGRGPGSTYAGYRLATVLRDGNVHPDGAGVVYWGLLSVGLGAAAIAATAPFVARPARVVRGVIGAAVVLPLALAAVTASFPPGDWAWGPWLALVGSLAAVGSALLCPAGPANQIWRPS